MNADTSEVTIEKLVYGGEGLARLSSGQVALVPWSVPEDQALVHWTSSQKNLKRGEISQLTQPSPYRIKPQCSVFGECGGCHWQHLTLEKQRYWKQQIVAENLRRIGKLSDVPVVFPIGDASDQGWHYRNKVEWLVHHSPGQQPQLGYSKFKSHQLVTFDHCWIMPESFNAIASYLKGQLEVLENTERIQSRINSKGDILLTFKGTPALFGALEGITPDFVTTFPQIVGITFLKEGKETCIWGQPDLIETIGTLQFQVSPQSFFQVNTLVAHLLLQYIEKQLLPDCRSLIDIYAGGGLFSIWLHQKAQQVVMIESSSHAIENAQVNLKLNHIDNIQLLQGDATKILAQVSQTFDVAIIDPPRTGCDAAVLKWLHQNIHQQILYVSCDPATLARDLKQLTSEGWRIEAVQPFDMFPQTYHIETVVSLKRKETA